MNANTALPTTCEKLVLLAGALVVSAGVQQFDQPTKVNAKLPSGVKIVVLISGRLRISVGNAEENEICGPAALVIHSPLGATREQIFAADVPVKYVIVQMQAQLVSDGMAAAMQMPFHAMQQARVMSCPIARPVQSLAGQILNCPIQGAERELYLAGKAMQLAALVISSCLASASERAAEALSARDVERIRRARELVVDKMRDPPSLEALAAQVGLNIRKLSDGFRNLYGTTVFGFLQEYRLEQAYKLIASGEMSVSEAASHVGYAAAHFATIFRKRFGTSPSSLR